MLSQQKVNIIENIKYIMEDNNIQLVDLIEYFDDKNNKLSTKINKSKKNIKKWGDEAVGLYDEEDITCKIKNEEVKKVEEVEEVEEVKKVEEVKTETLSWKDVTIKKVNTKTVSFENKKFKESKKEKFIVYSLHEFLEAIYNKYKLHIDFDINQDAHCSHTYNGTLCSNVKKCGKIHIQRCIHNLNCNHKHCPYLHINDMPTSVAKENFEETMDKYNFIKKNKRVNI
jgi:hypothetical protein